MISVRARNWWEKERVNPALLLPLLPPYAPARPPPLLSLKDDEYDPPGWSPAAVDVCCVRGL